jgi:hypothetical protein
LKALEILIEAFEALRPESGKRHYPVVDGLEPIAVQGIESLLPCPTHLDQADLLEDPQVLGRLRLLDSQGAGEVVDRAFPTLEQVEDLASPRLRDGVEDI